MEMKKDILETCRGRNPYSVPEGYFKSLEARLAKIPSAETFAYEPAAPADQRISPWTRLKPYAALAACFVIAFVCGTLILSKTAGERSSLDYYDSLVYSDLIPVTEPDAIFQTSAADESAVTDEDRISYLLACGVSAAQIGYVKSLNE